MSFKLVRVVSAFPPVASTPAVAFRLYFGNEVAGSMSGFLVKREPENIEMMRRSGRPLRQGRGLKRTFFSSETIMGFRWPSRLLFCARISSPKCIAINYEIGVTRA